MSEKLLENLRGYIEKSLEATNCPGAAIAVIQDGKVLCAQGFGYADLEGKVKMTAETILPMGSASKAFTATGAVMLAAEGRLDLDTPLAEYIPGFKLSDPEASANATARDLLCHRTGMPRHDLMWIGWNDLRREEVVKERLRHLPASKPFRSTWQYQNHMFATIGYLIEVISGKTWEDFVRERIFTPLGMDSGCFRVKYPDPTGAFAKLYSENKQGVNEETVPLVIDAMGPAGSINATVLDAAKWVIFNLDKGKADGKALIDEAMFAQLQAPNIPYTLLPFDIPESKRLGYSLGWFVDCYRGHKMVEHGGNVNGASALVSMLSEENIGCVILTNADHSLAPNALVYRIYDELLGCGGEKDWTQFFIDQMKPFIEQSKAQEGALLASRKEGKGMSHPIDAYVGAYLDPGYGDIEIYREGNGLRMKYHANDLPLNHLHYDIFYFELMGFILPVNARTGIDGTVESIELQLEGLTPPTVFKRQVQKK